MRSLLRLALAMVLAGASVLGAPGLAFTDTPGESAGKAGGLTVTASNASAVGPADRSGFPMAVRTAEPVLPVPMGWPLDDRFPRTSGTGRVAPGALLWSDFLYDDRGARVVPVATPVTPFAASRGTFEYADPDAHGNGADIFRAGIGVDSEATYWRVDWNTLADPDLPLAVYVLDTDRRTTTGVAEWPAAAGVHSPGVDAALVVSARGASLIDLHTQDHIDLEVIVDPRARSFVVRVPRSLLQPSDTWRVRLASGVADGSGRAFAAVPPRQGGRDGGARIYNVAFRRHEQEPVRLPDVQGPSGFNYWNEAAQAAALTSGDVSEFFVDVDWAELRSGRLEEEPQPTGWTTRWYVSSIELGHGITRDAGGSQDLRPNYLGRIQPYALYVPTSYDPARPIPLTWLLHSAFQPHNAFGAVTPRFVHAACEARGSLCATPLGRGHDGWSFDEAELDFWEVWARLLDDFTVDLERTVLGGFSMGGYGVYKLGLQHPHLFAAGVVIAATPVCGVRVGPGLDAPEAEGRCTTDGDTTPLLVNSRWLPLHISHGTADELLPISGTVDHVAELQRLGHRYRFEHHLGQPHIPWYFQDRWAAAAEWMGDRTRQRNPARFTLRWYPHLDRSEWGIGVTGAYWIHGVSARSSAPGTLAQIDAHSAALADVQASAVRTHSLATRTDATPALIDEQVWMVDEPAPSAAHARLDLSNVGALSVVLTDMGLPADGPASIDITTDGPVDLTLSGVGGLVLLDGTIVPPQPGSSRVVVRIPAGSHVVEIREP